MKCVSIYWCRGERFTAYIPYESPRQFLRDVAANERYLKRLVASGHCDGYVIHLEGEFSWNAAHVPV